MVKEAWPSITLIRSFNHLVSSNLNTVYPMGDNDRINVKLACFERDPHTKSALQIQSTNAYKLGSINIINSKKQKKFIQIAKKKKRQNTLEIWRSNANEANLGPWFRIWKWELQTETRISSRSRVLRILHGWNLVLIPRRKMRGTTMETKTRNITPAMPLLPLLRGRELRHTISLPSSPPFRFSFAFSLRLSLSLSLYVHGPRLRCSATRAFAFSMLLLSLSLSRSLCWFAEAWDLFLLHAEMGEGMRREREWGKRGFD